MPMLPYGGQGQPGGGFGPDAQMGLGAGSPTGAMDGMAANPTDPNAQVGMTPQAPMSGPSVSEAIQAALSQRQDALSQQHQQESVQLLMQDLSEAETMVTSLMQVAGQEAQTLDGAGGVPSGMPMDPAGGAGGPDANAALAESPPPALGGGPGGPPGGMMLGAGGPPPAAGGAPGGAPGGLAGMSTEELMAALSQGR